VLSQKSSLKNFKTFNASTEVTRILEPNSFEFLSSNEPRELPLKPVELSEGFEGVLENLMNSTNEVCFIAWGWDLYDQSIAHFPVGNNEFNKAIIRFKAGKLSDYSDDGVHLFPKRNMKGGLAIRILIWESDQNVLNFSKLLTETADAIEKSKLNNLLSLVSFEKGVSATKLIAIQQATLELAKSIGSILKVNTDEFVDFFEGYYVCFQSTKHDW
jgi:hypothetical protein